ncbi:MAG: hypothetical protein RL172_3217 [Bacteroidota bacterium]|jgi:membrane associated rhomboid family serine protease
MMQRVTPAVMNLIIINVLVYMAQKLITPVDVTNWGAMHYFKSAAFMPHQLITHMFMHSPAGIGHLMFNMLGLWMFGCTLENYIGSKRFLIFYLISGVGAGILTQFSIPVSAMVFANSADGHSIAAQAGVSSSQIADIVKEGYSLVGASGALMGVMAGYAYLFPNTLLHMFLVPVPVKAKYVVLLYVAMDLFGSFYRVPGDNVAHFTHLSGALIGFLLLYYWNKTNRKTFY